MSAQLILVASTLTTMSMSDEHAWGSWLASAEEMKAASEPHTLHFFCAIEMDARGIDPFAPLVERLAEIDGEYWTYHLDDGRKEVTMDNRLRHITVGQNLTVDRAVSDWHDWHLFLAADLRPPSDTVPKLLELGHPIVAGHVPDYDLRGNPVPGYPEEWNVQAHMASAAFVMTHRSLFRFMRWRHDHEAAMSDDPCWEYDARHFHGMETYVRHDVIGDHHWGEGVGSYRRRGYDTTVVH